MLGKILKDVFAPSQEEQSTPAGTSAAVVGGRQARAATHWSQYGGKTVISFTFASRSDGLGAGVNATAQIFREHGYRFENIDLRQDGWAERILELARKPEEILCAIGVAGTLGSLQPDGRLGEQAAGMARNLWSETGIPFLSVFGDHPAYFFGRHLFRGQGHFSLYCFEEHMQAARAWLDPQPMMAQMPLGAWHSLDKAEVDFKAKADGKVCFFKNGNDPAALRRFWGTLPQPMSGWLAELAHSIDLLKLGRSGEPLHVLVRRFIEDHGVFMDRRPWIELFLVAQLDDYARRLKSTLIAEALLDLPVNVFGDFWEHVDFTGRRAVRLPGRSYFETRQLVSEALCVIDMSPNVQSAPHDRFLSAIGRYTLCLTNAQKYYEDNYPRAGEMMFDFDAESIRDRVAGVLARPAQAVELGAEVTTRARELLSGRAAVEKLADYARLARFGSAPASFPGQQDFLAWPV